MPLREGIATRGSGLPRQRTSWAAAVAALLIVLACPGSLPASQEGQDGALFISSGCGSCEYSRPASWRRVRGTDADGVPDEGDDVVVASGDRVSVAPVGAAARNIDVRPRAELRLSGSQPRRLLARGQITVRGRLAVDGPHELVFYSSAEALAGIRVTGGELHIAGAEVGRRRVRSVEDHDAVSVLALEGAPHVSGELSGATLQVLSGLARGMVFDVIDNGDRWLTVSSRSRGGDGNAGFGGVLHGRGAEDNTLFVPPDLVAGRPVLGRAQPYSAKYVGRWLRFTGSGRHHLILQSVEGSGAQAAGRLELLPGPAPEDGLSTFTIPSGLSPGDDVVIFRRARATIPPENRASGRMHALLSAERARVFLRHAEFAYFGTRYDLETRLAGWPQEAGRSGLTFMDIDGTRPGQNLDMQFVEIHGGAAGAQVSVLRSRDAAISHAYMWDVHPAVNAPGHSDAGHGWYFEHASGLTFEHNTVLNQGDDHVYMEGVVLNASFRRNIFATSPAGLGQSTSNIEGVLGGNSTGIVVEENICLAADGNVSFTLERPGQVHVRRNVIASAFDENAANLSLVNAAGEIADNIVLRGALGIVVAGDSAVDVRRNLLRDHRLGVRNASRLVGNVLIRSPVNLNTAFGTPAAPIRIASNIFAGAHPAYGKALTVYDASGALPGFTIERNTIDAGLPGGARGVAVEIVTTQPVVVRSNIVVRAAIGISDASASPVVAAVDNWFVDMLNPSTGAPMNVLPDTLEQAGNTSGVPPGFSVSALGYGLQPASPAAQAEVGFVCAGLTGTGSFPLPLDALRAFIDLRSVATAACLPD